MLARLYPDNVKRVAIWYLVSIQSGDTGSFLERAKKKFYDELKSYNRELDDSAKLLELAQVYNHFHKYEMDYQRHAYFIHANSFEEVAHIASEILEIDMNGYESNCYHEYDCCGCAWYYTPNIYKICDGKYALIHTVHFNY